MPTHQYDYPKIAGFTIALVYFLFALLTPLDWKIIDSVNLVIHEAGHTILLVFPEMVTVMGGTLFQILLPTLFAAYFFYRKDRFSGYLVLFWVAQNFVNVSLYVKDAVLMNLELLGGEGTIHDWNYILTHLDLLEHTAFIAATFYAVGWIIFIRAATGALFIATKKVAFQKEDRGSALR